MQVMMSGGLNGPQIGAAAMHVTDARTLTYGEALREGLAEEMRDNPLVVAYGEDFRLGYVWPVGRGLIDEFGPERIRDVPLSEAVHVGLALGLAMAGATAVVEIQFADFSMLAMDQIVNQAAKMCYMTGGQARTGMVLRLCYGTIGNYAGQHSQTPYSMFAHVPGLLVAVPAFPDDAKGLMKTAITCGDPVVFFEHKKLYSYKGEVPEATPALPFGQARVLRQGDDVTIVAIGLTAHSALEAAEQLAAEGIEATVIDPRTLVPFDLETVLTSVRATGRVVIADESVLRGSFTAHIASEVTRGAFAELKAAPLRVGVGASPIPYSWALEQKMLASPQDIFDAVRWLTTDAPDPLDRALARKVS
jgi:pyruvate/2-oxoglutarate/acetoin dehydrogenase E1 component